MAKPWCDTPLVNNFYFFKSKFKNLSGSGLLKIFRTSALIFFKLKFQNQKNLRFQIFFETFLRTGGFHERTSKEPGVKA